MSKTMTPKPLAQKIEMPKPLKVGDMIEGRVIGTGRSAVYLDLGPRGTGIIYGREFLAEKEALKGVQKGDQITAKIVELENEDGYVELSLREAGRQLTWEKLREKKEAEETLKVKVTGANKGGLLLDLYGVQAFLPVSQLSSEHYPKVEGGDPAMILEALQKLIGEELNVQIFDLDEQDNKVILSERATERTRLKEVLEQFQVGDVVEGEITGIVDFGAFITFEAAVANEETGKEEKLPVEGLIHISEIDWQIIEDPADFLKVGEKVRAKIIDISNGRVSLSLKALKEDPWKGIDQKYHKLDTVEGKVTKLNPFGAFVEIEPKIQGLAHISEFGTKQKMEERLEVGKTEPFQILELVPEEHRMTLRPVTSEAPPAEESAPAPEEPEAPEAQEPKEEPSEPRP